MGDGTITKTQLAALREVSAGTVSYYCGPASLRRSYETWYTSRFAKRTFEVLCKADLITYEKKINCSGGSNTLVVVTDKGKALL